MSTIFFFILAAVSVISAILIVAQRNPVASALFLIVTLCSQAMLYLLLGASFLAVIQIIVYAGAIMVLFLFVIMLLNLRKDEFGPDKKRVQRTLALVLGAVWLIQLVVITKLSLSNKGLGQVTPLSALETGNVQAIGKSLFTEYLYPFEITSILLLVAILGSIVLAKKKI